MLELAFWEHLKTYKICRPGFSPGSNFVNASMAYKNWIPACDRRESPWDAGKTKFLEVPFC